MKLLYFNEQLITGSSTQVRGFCKTLLLLCLVLALYLPGIAQVTIPPCNTPTPLINPVYPTVIQTGNIGFLNPWTGNFGAALGVVANQNNVVDSDPATVATFISAIAISGGSRLTVRSINGSYPAGYYAGFDIRNVGVFGASLLGSLSVKTYLGTALQETYIGNSGSLAANIVNDGGRVRVGFVTTAPFDRIMIEQNQALSLNLGTTEIFNAVVEQFCPETLPRDCNVLEHLTNPTFPVFVNEANTGIANLICANCAVKNTVNLIDGDLDNYAEIDLLGAIAGSGSVSVKNQLTDYPAGTFAGFDVLDIRTLAVSFGTTHTITTFLNGVQQESIADGSTAIGGGFFTSSGRVITGFKTSEDFDEVQLTVSNAGTVGSAPTRIYGAVIKRFCAGPELPCNTNAAMVDPTYPVFVDGRNTLINSIACVQCDIVNPDNAVDSDPENYSELVIPAGFITTASYAVTDGATTYPAGTFAGFDIENTNLIGANALSGLTIETTLSDGTIVESFSGNSSLISANSALLNGTGRQTVGFVATLPFNGVKIIASSAVNANIGTTRIYKAVYKKFCAKAIVCSNTPIPATNPEWPVYVNGLNTSINAAGCVGCSINNSENVIDTDPTNFAQIVLLAGVGSQGQFSVKDQLTTYQPGTFAGLAIKSPSLINVNALSAITINTYNDGVLAETKTGTSLILSANTSILAGDGSQIAGFVATQPFDEVQIVATNLASVSIGTLEIYGAVFQTFCPAIVDCNTRYTLTQPDFPVVIDAGLTGVTGAACGGCYVKDANNLLTVSNTDYAEISSLVGAASSGSIAVQDALYTYTPGTFAGFTVQSENSIALASLLPGLTITTYLDGVEQESKTSGGLVDLDILFPILGSGGDLRNVGFVTSLPFDEIRISAFNLATLGIGNLKVYNALVDTHSAEGCSATVSGNIWSDTNHDGIIDGSETVPVPTGMYVALIDPSGNVVQNSLVNANGSYSLNGLPFGTTGYYLLLTTVQPTNGQPAPGAIAPAGWFYVTENNNGTPEIQGDGIILLSPTEANVTDLHFGISTTPLPVTLTKFSVVKEENTASLTWTTTEESNSQVFEIQRSANGKTWVSIGTREAKGQSAVTVNYNYADTAPLNGENLYRLKMIDKDGSFAYSRINSLNFNNTLKLSVYPNPVGSLNKVKIDGISIDDILDVKIYDQIGKVVYTSKKPVSNEIDVLSIPAGAYIVTVTGKNGVAYSTKIVIVK